MLIFMLNSNKQLSCNTTTSIYSNENNFDTIRIVASPVIDEKNIDDYKVELYVYNALNKDWNTFNDCIPCDFVLENNKYIFETPVKSQYTTCPRLGFYCKFTNQDGVVGKTNVVETPVLYHKDNTIDASNSIQVFEKYKEDLLKGASDILQDSNFIYFKKECDNWDAPRIYFFNKQYPDGGNLESWAFGDSPYMIQNDDGYYYYPLIKGYDNVIFFCDKRDSSYFNYKTQDLTIPSSNWYKSPLFVQSEIGFDGFWADYNTKITKLLVQLDWTSNSEINIYKDSNIIASYINRNEENILPKIYDFGMVLNGSDTFGRNPYKYIELPIDFTDLSITFHSISNNMTYTKTYAVKRREICYEYPVVYCGDFYNSANSQDLSYFNAYVDYNLRIRLENFDKELLRLIKNNKLQFERHIADVAIESGRNTDSTIYDNDNWDGTLEAKATLHYYKIGRLITCFVSLEVYDNLEEDCPRDWVSIPNLLPYVVSKQSPSSGIYISMVGSKVSMELHRNFSNIWFYNIRGGPDATAMFSYLTD